MQSLNDQSMLTKLKSEEKNAYELLYKFYYPTIAHYVKQNQGSSDDAKDVFQEAMVVLLEKVRQPEFILTSSLKTYLYAISKNIWLKRLRDNRLLFQENDFSLENLSGDFEEVKFDFYPEQTNESTLKVLLMKITNNCQRILKAIFFYEEPMESLMKKMGWKNKHTAANQKYKCIEQVKRERLKNEGAI